MPQLDSLRALAVIMVIFGHIDWQNDHVNTLTYYGLTLSVRMFFILSGFLITGILLRDLETHKQGRSRARILLQFYIRRILRIFPAYYIVLILGVLFHIPRFQDFIWWSSTFTINFLFAFSLPWAGPVAPFWTLAIEEQFYALWPFVLLYLGTFEVRKVMLVLLIASPVFRVACALAGVGVQADFLLPAIIDSFMAGGLLATLGTSHAPTSEMKRFVFFFYCAVIAVCILGFYIEGLQPVRDGLAHAACIPLLGWIIYRASIGCTGVVGAVLLHTMLRRIGKISYSMYLLHLPILYCITETLKKYESALSPQFYSPWALFSLTLIGSILVSAAIWLLVEKQVQRVKVHIGRTL